MTDLMGADHGSTQNAPGAVDVAEVVASAFAHALQTPEVTPASNFFALGGNSLQAAALVAQLRGQLGVKVAIRDLFRAPTVAGLTGAIHQRIAASGSGGALGSGTALGGGGALGSGTALGSGGAGSGSGAAGRAG